MNSITKKIIYKIMFLILLIGSGSCLAESKMTIGAQSYLQSQSWNESQRYDASHFLMIPLFYAFEKNDQNLINAYNKYVENFYSKSKQGLQFDRDNIRLSNTQFLYFLSTYAVLSGDHAGYSRQMLSNVESLWSEIPAWQWGQEPFDNMKQRFDWKLNAPISVGYYRAIIDEELFVLGAAANLSRIYPDNPTLKEINQYSARIFKQRSTFDGNRWLFDVGSWDNHPKFAYSGYSNTKSITVKKPKNKITADSSHFFRMPVLLWSLQGAYAVNSKENTQFKSYRFGLENQFFEKVVVLKDNKILLNNYMDGSNGVFNWVSSGSGKGKGYGPYGLTSSFGMGWWALLPGNRIQSLYHDYFEKLSETYTKESCDSIINNLITDQSAMMKTEYWNCLYLYNSYLASNINQKRI